MLIALESGRPVLSASLPARYAVAAITVGELHAGVLVAQDADSRSRRLATLSGLSDVQILPVDESVAAEWGRLRVHLLEVGRRLNVNDVWIASTAIAHGLTLVTQDDDFDALDGVRGLTVVRV